MNSSPTHKQKIYTYFEAVAPWCTKWKKKSRYYQKSLEALFQFLVPKHCSVLEIGCGTGELLAAVNPSRGTGIDISPRMVKIAQKQHPHLEFYAMDAENITLNTAYDYIILSDTISFLSDIERALREVQKITHPRSRIIINYYNYLWEPLLALAELLRLKMPLPRQNWVTTADIENLLYITGFESVRKLELVLIPFYIPIISSLVNKYAARLPLIKNFCLVYCLVARPMPQARASFSNKQHSVSVIVPARNEAGNIEQIVKSIPRMGFRTEVIFVEGHSKDGTLNEIKRVQGAYPYKDIKIFTQDGEGKGDAVRRGFREASGEILMILDADLSVQPNDLTKFYDALTQGAGDFINGSRLVYPLQKESMRFLNILGNKFFSIMFSWLIEQKIKDTLCGTKVLWREDYEKIRAGRHFFGEFDPFGDFDLLFGASKLNLKIIDLPVRYYPRVYGKTNISRFAHGWLLLRMCVFAMRKIKFI